MDKMPQEAIDLLTPIIVSEETARYFYEAARTWARGKGYPGAERQFNCYVHYHKHNLKKLMNTFADWNGKIVFGTISAPASYFPGGLPDAITEAANVEEGLMGQYNKAATAIMGLHLGIFDEVDDLRKRETGFYQEMDEFVEKLQLIDVKNGLDLVYFDRKVIRW